MDINDITENSMEKLHTNLLELNNNINENPTNFKDTIKFNEDRINNKLIDYKSKPDQGYAQLANRLFKKSKITINYCYFNEL